MIPRELQEIPQWTYSFSAAEIKRPTHTKYLHRGALSYKDALKLQTEGTSIGMYTTRDDPYVIGDIDHVDVENLFDEIPDSLVDLLTSKPTYLEVSPSGEGVRFIYRLPSADEKLKLKGSNFLQRSDDGGTTRDSQINVGPPWMRMTGNSLPFSTKKIATVTLEELNRPYNVIRSEEKVTYDTAALKLAPIREVEQFLMLIPTDQNLRVQRAYKAVFNQDYQHYDFWMRVLMALHNYAQLTGSMVECLGLAIKWSSTDPVAYTGEDAVLDKWRSFSQEKMEVISYRTLFKLANMCYLRWPVTRKQSKSAKERRDLPLPLNTEVVNFRYLLDYYDVKIYTDIGNPSVFYLTGDPDVTTQYFAPYEEEILFDKFHGPFSLEAMCSAFLSWCQSAGFIGITRTMIRSHVLLATHASHDKLDVVRYYFDKPFLKLPQRYQENKIYYNRSSFDDLFSCLELDFMTENQEAERNLYETYYRVWLYGLIRTIDHPEDPTINNCVLLLTGREQIRKTSHFRYLLPRFMRERFISFTTHGFAKEGDLRDVAKISASSRVIVWDELEQYLNALTESNFKKLIDNTPQTIIDKYETIPRTIRPVSIYGATSNLREFKLGSEGSRRLFHIPVKWVDTDSMENICWHKLINDLRKDARAKLASGKIPWLLSEEQLDYQRGLHSILRAKNNIDIMLEEVFNFDHELYTKHGVLQGIKSVQTDKSGRLQNTKEVIETLGRLGYHVHTISRAAVIQSLRRLCGNYTSSSTKTVNLYQPKGRLYKGEVTQGRRTKWVLPPMRKGATGGRFSHVNTE